MPSKDQMEIELSVYNDSPDALTDKTIINDFFNCGEIKSPLGSKITDKQVYYLRESCMMSTLLSGMHTLNKRLDLIEKKCGK